MGCIYEYVIFIFVWGPFQDLTPSRNGDFGPRGSFIHCSLEKQNWNTQSDNKLKLLSHRRPCWSRNYPLGDLNNYLLSHFLPELDQSLHHIIHLKWWSHKRVIHRRVFFYVAVFISYILFDEEIYPLPIHILSCMDLKTLILGWGISLQHDKYFPCLPMVLLMDIAVMRYVNFELTAAPAAIVSASSILADVITSALIISAFIFLLWGTGGTSFHEMEATIRGFSSDTISLFHPFHMYLWLSYIFKWIGYWLKDSSFIFRHLLFPVSSFQGDLEVAKFILLGMGQKVEFIWFVVV